MSEPYSDNAAASLGALREPTPADYDAVTRLITTNARDPQDRQQLLDAVLGPLSTTKTFTGEHAPAHYMAGCRHPDCIRANAINRREVLAGRPDRHQEGKQ